MRILRVQQGYPIFSDTPEDIHVLDDPEYRGSYILQGPEVSGTGRATRMTTPSEEVAIALCDAKKAASSLVYFIQAGRGGPIKIGHSRSVLARLRKLQAGSPLPLTLLRTESGGERREKELHEQFAEFRLHGEWFTSFPLLEYLGKKG